MTMFSRGSFMSGKSDPTGLFFQESSLGYKLRDAEVNLRPGRSISPGQGDTPLLAAGFASIYPENEFPLSPTLQLNYDLASFELAELEKVAAAELQRQGDISYKSYVVDVDSSACVIGADAAEISTFIDTYGGILNLEPLLIKGYDPEIPTAVDLQVESDTSGCRLSYQIRSPIDRALCTYCGDCGAACPLKCISETLFVNYEICNLCKECETACGVDAIDIHGVVSHSLEVAAIIVLGDPQIDLTGAHDNVFYEKNIADYFATLYPYQVDEVVTCDNSICQYSGNLKHGCDLCLSHCEFGAIQQGDEVVIDHAKCEECGGCISVCPTGAIQNQRFNDASFIDYFQTINIPPEATVIIGDEQTLHRFWWNHRSQRWSKVFFLEYENVESLSLFHFMFLINQGVRRVIVVNEFDSEGETVSVSGLQKQMVLGSEVINKLYDIEDALVSTSIWKLGEALAEEVSGIIGSGKKIIDFSNRRQALAQVLEELVSHSGREVEISVDGYIPFATVNCHSDRCTDCMACLNDCKIGAMVADEEQMILGHVGVMCVGCGLCAKVCPEDALYISPEFTLCSSFFTEKVLDKAEPMKCRSCGKVFGTKKSFEKVMAILSARESVDVTHFEHCETCRVVKLFDE